MLRLTSPRNLNLGDLLTTPWSQERYLSASRAWKVGELSLGSVTDARLALLYMPIKLPDGELYLPQLPAWLTELVVALGEFEKELHSGGEMMYAYLTVNQGVVKAGSSQRNSGAHFDGMQGARYPDKLPPCHQYLYATAAPTVIYEQPFNLCDLDVKRDNFFRACEHQKHSGWQPAPGDIVLSTAYTVHESPRLLADTWRTFVRVEFSHKRADRDGNTLNPALRHERLGLRATPNSRTSALSSCRPGIDAAHRESGGAAHGGASGPQ